MIAIASGAPRRLARAWLAVGLCALAGGGLLAILLVLARTPGIQDLLPLRDFFRAALIAHVDLTVAVWFMAFAAVMWSALGDARGDAAGRAAAALAAAGMLLMLLAPFFPAAQPLLNDYIPVLRHGVFYASLGLCGAGFGLALLRALATTWPRRPASEPLRLGAFLGAVAGTCAFAAFLWSWLTLPRAMDQAYFEALFWSGGHLLQYQHALLTVVAWLWCAGHLGAKPAVGARTLSLLFVLAALPVLAAPVIYIAWPAGEPQHVAAFARLMVWGHPAMAPLIVVALASLWQLRAVAHAAKSALYASFVLFAVGGVLGYLIRGANVVIPAHYHGAIVGVTLAFMGLAYVLLPQLGFRAVDGRLARLQPIIYGGGQLLHILGLAWSGGYGVQRKAAGAEQALSALPQQLGMALMGLGGLIAVIGGLLFVLLCLRAMWPRAG
ncbi:MAG: cbb3-type cytochrome c oxidase subunit I [Rhodocyclaceae bacterium]|nr:cbb3-type cytochrome c oxidase subunit I [Rhodocyclaceae bacterium]